MMGDKYNDPFAPFDLIATFFERLAEHNTAQTENSNVMVAEIRRFRVWEQILYVFFGRYYFERADPVGAAEADCRYLQSCYLRQPEGAQGAELVGRIYSGIIGSIKACQASGNPSRDGGAGETTERVM